MWHISTLQAYFFTMLGATFVFAIVTVLELSVIYAKVDSITVYVEVVSDSNQRKRGRPSEDVEVQFRMGEETVTLQLKENPRINLDIPVTFENPESAIYAPKIKNVHFYQDLERNAAVTLTRPAGRGALLEMNGVFNSNGVQYEIRPDSNPARSRPKHQVKRQESPQNVTSGYNDYNIPPDTNTPNYQTINKGGKDVFFVYNVEIIFVLDHKVWEYWLGEFGDTTEETALYNIKLHYLQLMNLIDMTYNDLKADKHGFEIEVWLKGFHIAKTVKESKWTAKSLMNGSDINIDGDLAIDRLGKWSVSDGRTWYNTDFTILFTKYDLFGNTNVGYGWIGGICTPKYSVSIIEDHLHGLYLFAAEQLAFSLGAYPDGREGTNGNDCPGDGPHIMGYWNDLDFTFSKCTVKYFKRNLLGIRDGYPKVCLTNRVCDHDTTPLEDVEVEYDMTHPPSLDDQCRRAYGPDSYNCAAENDGHPFCQWLACYKVYTGVLACYYSKPGALEYTVCDEQKWCRHGSCVLIENHPPELVSGDFLDPTCIATGLETDVPKDCKDKNNWSEKINGVRYTSCLSMLLEAPKQCFMSKVAKDGCCATCHLYGAVTPTQHEYELHETGDVCPPGKYKQGKKCHRCLAGTYRPISGGVQAASCAPCQPGLVSDKGSTRCTECSPGEYAEKAGKKRCTECPVGTYQDESGSSECKDCPGNEAPGSIECPGAECEDKFSLKKCQRYKRKNRCTSEEKAKDSGLSWIDYLEDNCKKTCQLCNPN